MNRYRGVLLSAAAVALLFVPVIASAQDTAGAIAGTIVSTETPAQPVRRALVTISGGTIPGNLSAVTDDGGRFQFLALAPGRYTLSVTKPAYLPATYGATRPGRPGTSIVIAAGQTVNVRVPLSRGAVITGTVRDEFGQPISGIRVVIARAEEVTAVSGFLNSPNELLTDDRGVYRAHSLSPGEYVVSAAVRNPGGGDTSRVTQAEVDARMRALEQRFGQPGSAALGALAPAGPPSSNQSTSASASWGFAPVFYPGTPIPAEAARIRVAAGEERAAVDIPLVPVRTARVSGVIQGNGDVVVTRIRPSMAAKGPAQVDTVFPIVTGPAADGSFSFNNVAPGSYTLLVRTGDGAMMRTADGRGGSDGNPGVPSLFAQTEIEVNGADISGLVFALRPALSIAGRVVFDASTLTPPVMTGIRVSVVASDAVRAASVLDLPGLGPGRLPSTGVSADGSFRLVGIIPGSYTLASSAPSNVRGSTWWLRSIVADGRDILDHPLTVDGNAGDVSNVVITFTDRHSGVLGTLTTTAAQPASEFTVVAFPTDRGYWRAGARRIKLTRPGSDGAFALNDLPAGEYYLAALVDVETSDLQQEAFLESLLGASVKITIVEAQQLRQDVRIK